MDKRKTHTGATPAGVRNGSRARSSSHEHAGRHRPVFADRARRRGRILVVLASICCAELGMALRTTPALNVRQVSIEGIARDGSITLAEAAITQQAATLPVGTNWLIAPVTDMRHKLAALPWLRSAEVHRRLPLNVSALVEVRRPSYALFTRGSAFEMDADNVPIRLLRPAERLTPIVLESLIDVTPGTAVNSAAVVTSARVLSQTRSDPVLHIAKIVIDQSTNIWLNMGTGVRVKFGHCDQVKAKIAMLRRILVGAHQTHFVEINLTNPDWPAGSLAPTKGDHSEVAATSPDGGSGPVASGRSSH